MQNKRLFRPSAVESPEYPTHEKFQPTRRGRLARLGMVVLAATSAGTLFLACGERATDELHILAGLGDAPAAPIDAGIEGGQDRTGGIADVVRGHLDANATTSDGGPEESGTDH
jgi:hypothetical protein